MNNKNNIKRLLVLISFISLMVGCAKTTVEHFNVGNLKEIKEEKQNKGIRYYENAPYILVYSEKGHYSSSFVWLPDTTSISAATPTEFLASNKLNMDFTEGVLTLAQSIGDSTKIPSAFISVAKDVALAAAKASAAANTLYSAPTPQNVNEPIVYLYRIDIDKNGKPVLYGDSKPIALVKKE